MSEPTTVYRFYDVHKVLIYVGITKRGIIRQSEHNEHSEWWPFVTSQEVDHHETREIAASQESFLIRKHRPPFNKSQNPDHERMRAAYLILFGPRATKPKTIPPVSIPAPVKPAAPAEPKTCGHCYACTSDNDDVTAHGPCEMLEEEDATDPCEHCGLPSHRCLWSLGNGEGQASGWHEGRRDGEKFKARIDAPLHYATETLTAMIDGSEPPSPPDVVAALRAMDEHIAERGIAAIVADATDPWKAIPF